EVRGDRVDPRRELLGLVEAVQVPEHPDEDLLHELLRALALADRAVHEVEQPALVAVDEGAERLGIAGEMPLHHLGVGELVEGLPLQGPHAGLRGELEDCSHKALRVRTETWTARRCLPLPDVFGMNRTAGPLFATHCAADASSDTRVAATPPLSTGGDTLWYRS